MNESDQPGLSFLGYILAFLAIGFVSATILIVPAFHAASLSDDAKGAMLVLFSPAVENHDVFSAIHEAGGLAVRKVDGAPMWVVQAPETGFVPSIKTLGAWAVFGDTPMGIVLAGCSGVIAKINQ